MIKISLLIIQCFILSLLSHAQRLNSKGLKMVSEIEVRGYNGHRFLGTM